MQGCRSRSGRFQLVELQCRHRSCFLLPLHVLWSWEEVLSEYKKGASIYPQGFYVLERGAQIIQDTPRQWCHREAVDALVFLSRCTNDVGELQSAEHQAEKARNLLLALQNIRSLARRGLPLQGDGDKSSSNFIQLPHLRGVDLGGIDRRQISTPHLKSKMNACTSWGYIFFVK